MGNVKFLENLPEITCALYYKIHHHKLVQEEVSAQEKEDIQTTLGKYGYALDGGKELDEKLKENVKKVARDKARPQADVSEVHMSADSTRKFTYKELIYLFDHLILQNKELENKDKGAEQGSDIVIFFDFKNFQASDEIMKLQSQLCLVMKCQEMYGEHCKIQLRDNGNPTSITKKEEYTCQEAIEYLKGLGVGQGTSDEGINWADTIDKIEEELRNTGLHKTNR